MPFSLHDFFTGPEFLTVFANFISTILSTIAVQIWGQALGQTG